MNEIQPMTAEELAELKRLSEVATPGPWDIKWDSCDCEFGCSHKPWISAIYSTTVMDEKLPWKKEIFGDSAAPDIEDATFIVASRIAVSRLIAEVECLRKQRAEDIALMAETVEAQKLGLATIGKLQAEAAEYRMVLEKIQMRAGETADSCESCLAILSDACDVLTSEAGKPLLDQLEHLTLARNDELEVAEYRAQQWEETASALLERAEKAEAALRGFVTLKDHKDACGKDGFYLQEQPNAWAKAREILAGLDGEISDVTP